MRGYASLLISVKVDNKHFIAIDGVFNPSGTTVLSDAVDKRAAYREAIRRLEHLLVQAKKLESGETTEDDYDIVRGLIETSREVAKGNITWEQACPKHMPL